MKKPKNNKIPVECKHCEHKWETTRVYVAYCPKCGRALDLTLVPPATEAEAVND